MIHEAHEAALALETARLAVDPARVLDLVEALDAALSAEDRTQLVDVIAACAIVCRRAVADSTGPIDPKDEVATVALINGFAMAVRALEAREPKGPLGGEVSGHA